MPRAELFLTLILFLIAVSSGNEEANQFVRFRNEREIHGEIKRTFYENINSNDFIRSFSSRQKLTFRNWIFSRELFLSNWSDTWRNVTMIKRVVASDLSDCLIFKHPEIDVISYSVHSVITRARIHIFADNKKHRWTDFSFHFRRARLFRHRVAYLAFNFIITLVRSSLDLLEL